VTAVLTVLVAFPLGWFVRNRVAGFLAYGLLMAHLYTFQTANLVMEWVNGADAAFAQTTSRSLLDVSWGYLAVTSFIYAIGLGLVALGQQLRLRRDRRREAVQLEPVG
jgi:hypothetical protein